MRICNTCVNIKIGVCWTNKSKIISFLDILATMRLVIIVTSSIKMILETTQLLYTAWWFGRDTLPLPELDTCPHDPYRPTHKNHPSAIWVRADPKHYEWLLELGFSLCEEYYKRYNGKFHKCLTHLERLQSMGPPPKIKEETYA